MATVTYLVGATNEVYSGESLAYVAEFSSQINEVAGILGISAGAIAGAMAEERTAYGPSDALLDIYAKSGFDPAVAIETLPAAMAAGTVGISVWSATHAAQLTTVRTHAQWQALYVTAISFDGKPEAIDKITEQRGHGTTGSWNNGVRSCLLPPTR